MRLRLGGLGCRLGKLNYFRFVLPLLEGLVLPFGAWRVPFFPHRF